VRLSPTSPAPAAAAAAVASAAAAAASDSDLLEDGELDEEGGTPRSSAMLLTYLAREITRMLHDIFELYECWGCSGKVVMAMGV